jgi:arginyl-tRNA synthetase
MYLIEELRSAAAAALSEAAGQDVAQDQLVYSEDSANGDLAFPCFALAKTLKSAPPKIASGLAAKLAVPPGFAKVEAKGPYLNFFLASEALVEKASAEALSRGQVFGDRADIPKEKVMVEYVSPNNNKPLHLGHVRNGLIGESVSNLLESQGHSVVRSMILNDRGLAIAKAMLAYAKWGEGKVPADKGMKGDHFVAEYYVLYEKKAKEDPTLVDETHEIVRKWEAGDEATRALWRTMSDWCEAGQHATYKRLGFRFDVEYKESEIYQHGKDIVEAGLKKGIFEKDETGAVFARLEAHGLPDKVVLRADGTSLYITQDLFLAKKKFEEHGLDRSLYVVGNEQNLTFKQLFKILELLGEPWASKLHHLSYGYVTLPEGRMKSREGTVVDADDLVTALETDAAIEIKQRHPTITDDELVRRAHQLAMAAVKFHFLDVDIVTDTVYDPKVSLSFTGKTGPYVQYMHARVRSILRKAGEAKAEGTGRHAVPAEHRLAALVARYPETVANAAASMRPSLVAGHLYETAKALAAFYENAQVLNASEEDRNARLKLAEATGIVLKNGLKILGIEAPEEM